MGDKGDESQGQKMTKDGDDSLWNGPVKKRCCTDIICTPIFIVHILAFYVLIFMNAGIGNPYKLIKPRDFKGNFCGIGSDSQWKGGDQPNMADFGKLMWAMNVDETFGIVAQQMACSPVGYSALVSPGFGPGVANVSNQLSKDDYNKYCGISGTPLADAAAAATALQQNITDSVSAYSDPSQAYKLFMSGNQMGATVMREVTKYFKQVCAKACDQTQNSTASDPNRDYTYMPSPMKMWGSDPNYRAKAMWEKFTNEIGQHSATQGILASFIFKTWPKSVCPYDNGKYCVPMPGIDMTEIGNFGMCVPKVSGPVASLLTGAAAKGFEALSTLSVTEDAKRGLGDVIADIIKTYDVFIIVCFMSLIVGLLVLVVMRFVLCPMIWASLFIIFLIFIGGGLLLVARSSQCADQAFVDAAKSTADVSSAASGASPFAVECPGGFAIQSSEARDAAKYFGFFVMGCGGLWALAILCFCSRIQLAIAINQVACQFLYHNPTILFIPIIQCIIALCWTMIWCYCASFLLSQTPEDVVPNKSYATYNEAFGTSTDAGACTNMYPSGGVYVDEFGAECSGAAPKCYKCSAPRYNFSWVFGYAFLSFLWNNFFIIAVGHCIIAGAVGIWFFTPRGEKWKRATTCVAVKNALLWHTGSLAFSSLILAIVVWVKWFMHLLAKQAEANKNKVLAYIFKCLAYLIYCFEKCVKFLTRNAHIQIALMGTNFCTSAKNAFWLILRNAGRFGVITVLSHIVHTISMILIIGLTCILGYVILEQMYPEVNPIAPTIFYGIIGYMVSKLFIGTFALAVDATLHCLIAAEEMDAGNDFAPEPLKNFIKEKQDSGEATKQGACDGCCCTIM